MNKCFYKAVKRKIASAKPRLNYLFVCFYMLSVLKQILYLFHSDENPGEMFSQISGVGWTGDKCQQQVVYPFGKNIDD